MSTVTGKTSECYCQVFNWITSAVQDLDPSYIGVDFEHAFFSNVAIHFPEAKRIGCLFHFKQAARRKMKQLRFPDDEVKFAMRKGVYDLVTVIPLEHLTLGIGLAANMINSYLISLYVEESDECENA